MPPGGDELFSLLQLKRHVGVGRVGRRSIVDCAPTGETLRLLSFPDAARWWLDKVFGREQPLLAAARPLARDVPRRLAARRARVRRGPAAGREPGRDARAAARPRAVSMRLVMTPDRMVVAEAMRTFTYLNLYGYLTDAVVVNRVFPDELVEALLRRLARRAARAARARRVGLRPGAGAARALLRAGGARRRRCSTGSASALFAGATTAARCCTTGSPRSCRSDGDGARAAARPAVRRARATSRSRRSGSSSSCASTARSARSCCRRRWRRLQADVGDVRRRLARGVLQ